MSRKLRVYLNKVIAGEFIQDLSGRLAFIYENEYLKNPDSIPLSLSLPLKSETFNDKATRAFFSGLLPDEHQRELLAKNLGLSKQNPFSLLCQIGRDCAGAIEIYPPTEQPPYDQKPEIELLSEEQIYQIIKQLPKFPLLAGNNKLKLSLAGAQSKVAVFYDLKKTIALIKNSPSTHILKPAIAGLEDSVYNELFCLKLASKSKLNAAEVILKFAKKEPYLLIERYDRIKNNSQEIMRIHQEDFCQALSIAPELKYQREGGPTIKSCLALIEQHSSHPAKDILNFIRVIIFNYLIGNNDAHGKNFSFLYKEKSTSLAPFYDLVSTKAYQQLDEKMAMKIGNVYEPKRVLLKHWYEIISDTNTARNNLNKELKFFAVNLPKKALLLKEQLENENIKSPIFKEICQIISLRSKHILNYFEA